MEAAFLMQEPNCVILPTLLPTLCLLQLSGLFSLQVRFKISNTPLHFLFSLTTCTCDSASLSSLSASDSLHLFSLPHPSYWMSCCKSYENVQTLKPPLWLCFIIFLWAYILKEYNIKSAMRLPFYGVYSILPADGPFDHWHIDLLVLHE